MNNSQKKKKKNYVSGVLGLVLGCMVMLLSVGCIPGFDSGSTITQIQQTDGTVVTTTTNVNNSDSHDYYVGAIKHVEADSQKLSLMTASVMNSPACSDCTEEGKAWATAFKMVVVGYGVNFKANPYTAEKSKGVWDVTEAVVNGAVKIATGGILSYGDFKMGYGSEGVGGFGEGVRIEMGDSSSIIGSFHEQDTTTSAITNEGDSVVTVTPSGGDSSTDESESFSDSYGDDIY